MPGARPTQEPGWPELVCIVAVVGASEALWRDMAPWCSSHAGAFLAEHGQPLSDFVAGGSARETTIACVRDFLLIVLRLGQAAYVTGLLARRCALSARALGIALSARADALEALRVGGALLLLGCGLQVLYGVSSGGDFLYEEIVLPGRDPALASPQAFGWELAATALVGPAAEELLFRGIFQRLLHARLPSWGAVLVGAFLFAMAHVRAGAPLPLLPFAGGVAFGFAYARTRRLAAPFAVHACANAALTLLPFVYRT
ncbi:MAG: CPBP family intramembrane metalloprotease [Planctomycetes bacterium]|nr:CPBP family intramembrane metalloprotease [Planctomycetota bacterium]